MKKLKYILFALICLFVMNMFVKNYHKEKKEMQNREVVTISATDLFRAYDANEVATDEKLKGKLIAITGSIQSVDKDFSDDIIISIKTPNEFMPARLELKENQKEKAASLRKGQRVSVTCEKVTRLVGAPSGSDCYLN